MLTVANSETIKKAQEGDSAVIGALFEEYHASIFRYLYYKVGDFHTAEDLASEVFLRMIRSLVHFQPSSISFQAWLFQIARNLAIDHFRAQKIRISTHLDDQIVTSHENTERAVENNMDSEHLRLALDHLSDDQRDVIIMRFIAGMPITETAQTLHKSEDSIKGLQRRALANLRQVLTDLEVPHDEQR